MNTDPQIEEEDEADEPRPFLLSDGDCAVFDADLLDPVNECDGVIAVQFKDGALWWLSGRDRKWHNAESEGRSERKLRPVN